VTSAILDVVTHNPSPIRTASLPAFIEPRPALIEVVNPK